MATNIRMEKPECLEPPQVRQPYTPPPRTYQDSSSDDLSTVNGQPHHASPGKRRAPKEKQDSLGAMLRRGIMEHQLGLSVNIMLFVALSWLFFPSLRDRMSAFFRLSYPSSAQKGMYNQGPRDLYLVPSFVVFFTALRAFSLDYLLMPLASWFGISRQKGRVRFAEQSYMMVYYAIYWTWGLLLFINNTPSSTRNIEDLLISLWTDYPRLLVGASMKLYYLSQLAFWIQQIVVIHIEERRKDHWQMLTHHFITVSLLSGSYPYRQWRVGNAVLVCMDIVDFIFPLAKILRYLSLQAACDAAFALFVIFWFGARHVAYLAICWSIYAHVNSATMPYGLYSTRTGAKLSDNGGNNIVDNLFQPILHPNAETVSFNPEIRYLFLGLLLALQCITIAWFVMICRVVMRVIRGEGADDSRSDDDEGDADEEQALVDADGDLPAQPSAPLRGMPEPEKPQRQRFIEVESTSEETLRSYQPKRKGSNGQSRRKAKGISSGLNLGEHKEILNRIGCLSDEQLAREREKREGSVSPMPASGGRK